MSEGAAGLRLVSWNIRQGGGGGRAPRIAAELLRHAPDVVVLCEYRPGRSAPIVDALRGAGLAHVAATEPHRSANGVAVCSRLAFHRLEPAALSPLERERWVELELPAAGFALAALYVPPIRSGPRLNPSGRVIAGAGPRGPMDSGEGKEAFWRTLLALAEQSIHEEFLIVGDLNTGRHHVDEQGATFACEASFAELVASGWVDAWRARNGARREYSHGRPERGHRIDHALLSPSLAPRLAGCRYSHGERDVERLSDHSPLVLDLAAEA